MQNPDQIFCGNVGSGSASNERGSDSLLKKAVFRMRILMGKNNFKKRKSEEISCFEMPDVLLVGYRILKNPSRRPKNKYIAIFDVKMRPKNKYMSISDVKI